MESSEFQDAAERLEITVHYSHSVINETRKSVWLKGFSVIEMWPYRRFYRLHWTPFAGAGDGTIGSASTLSALLSIAIHLSALNPALER